MEENENNRNDILDDEEPIDNDDEDENENENEDIDVDDDEYNMEELSLECKDDIIDRETHNNSKGNKNQNQTQNQSEKQSQNHQKNSIIPDKIQTQLINYNESSEDNMIDTGGILGKQGIGLSETEYAIKETELLQTMSLNSGESRESDKLRYSGGGLMGLGLLMRSYGGGAGAGSASLSQTPSKNSPNSSRSSRRTSEQTSQQQQQQQQLIRNSGGGSGGGGLTQQQQQQQRLNNLRLTTNNTQGLQVDTSNLNTPSYLESIDSTRASELQMTPPRLDFVDSNSTAQNHHNLLSFFLSVCVCLGNRVAVHVRERIGG